ncbi:sporulation protein YunB [Cohnella cholangitidis]|uniref:Sporulation protein YunB n=1 Tax=Cohnella cholangitidis TaxID=2598458 RepID=A0A7G5BVF4_9BACL|nr:sporulation protein YunB [Cohnella cholangitidis]QMV40938.1 sporulation protein YunB [Cohnella cholangitidis]
MRRKWGRGLDLSFLRNGSLPKLLPRKWGRGGVFFRNGSPSRQTPRKWGTRRRFTVPGSGPSSGSGYTPAKRWTPRRPRRKMRRKHFWLIMALAIAFLIIQGTIFLDRELRQPLMFLAKIRVHQLATEAINAAIKEEIAQTADSDKLIRWKSGEGGKITGFEIDYKQQMAITAKTIDVVNRVLKESEEVPEHIPVGHALNSPFISSIGPSVAVKFHPASVVKVDVETESSEAGINMLLVEVFVRIRTEISVVIPFDKEPETLETKIPLSYALVVGDVPTYYYDYNGNPVGNGAAQAPSIALPTPNNAPEKPASQADH